MNEITISTPPHNGNVYLKKKGGYTGVEVGVCVDYKQPCAPVNPPLGGRIALMPLVWYGNLYG